MRSSDFPTLDFHNKEIQTYLYFRKKFQNGLWGILFFTTFVNFQLSIIG